jgi:hypothetical protein
MTNLDAYPANPRSRGVSADAALSEKPWTLTGQRQSQVVARPVADDSVTAGKIHDMLFTALERMKIHTSLVAMHMDAAWRTKLFAQLDRLHDPVEWDPADCPISLDSYRTLLRLMFVLQPNRRPGLSLANHGHAVAMWRDGENRLSIECRPNDALTVVLSRRIGNNPPDAAAISTTIERVADLLNPYAPECWFDPQ